jgi:hypothetical protein
MGILDHQALKFAIRYSKRLAGMLSVSDFGFRYSDFEFGRKALRGRINKPMHGAYNGLNESRPV